MFTLDLDIIFSFYIQHIFFFFFFFFQAEDGIRDYKVTGVQTCALPIAPFSASCASSQTFRRCCVISRSMKADRKSTRLNSSHLVISYAVFCLKKKKTKTDLQTHASDLTLDIEPATAVLVSTS